MATDEDLAPLAEVGVELVDDVVPYEHRKLWLLNGSHSALAYGGLLAGCGTIAEAVDHDTVSRFVRRLVDDVLGVSPSPTRSGPPSSPPRRSVASAIRPSDTRARRSPPTVRASCPNASGPWLPPERAQGSIRRASPR